MTPWPSVSIRVFKILIEIAKIDLEIMFKVHVTGVVGRMQDELS